MVLCVFFITLGLLEYSLVFISLSKRLNVALRLMLRGHHLVPTLSEADSEQQLEL
jgi:hypothetical protein